MTRPFAGLFIVAFLTALLGAPSPALGAPPDGPAPSAATAPVDEPSAESPPAAAIDASPEATAAPTLQALPVEPMPTQPPASAAPADVPGTGSTAGASHEPTRATPADAQVAVVRGGMTAPTHGPANAQTPAAEPDPLATPAATASADPAAEAASEAQMMWTVWSSAVLAAAVLAALVVAWLIVSRRRVNRPQTSATRDAPARRAAQSADELMQQRTLRRARLRTGNDPIIAALGLDDPDAAAQGQPPTEERPRRKRR